MNKEININWLNLKSIKKAEKKKTELENKGFKYIQTIKTGLNTDRIIYGKYN